MNSFSMLMEALAERIPMRELTVDGDEANRIAKLIPKSDGKERFLYWRGTDPDPSEFQAIVEELVAHLDLR